MKNLSKQLSGITLVKLIIIITRTQSRKKKFAFHHKYSLLSFWVIVQAIGIPEARVGVGGCGLRYGSGIDSVVKSEWQPG